jgi:hypothetical protein
MTTFTVDDVRPVGEADWEDGRRVYLPYEPFPTVGTRDMFRAKLGKLTHQKGADGQREFGYELRPIEACSEAVLIGPSSGLNPLIECLNQAYDHHLPVVLTPDVIWTCIGQGLATHIKLNSERVRHQFVQHTGKEFIEIERNGFVKGSPDNDWPGCFDEFGRAIKGFIGDKYELFVGAFETTGPLEKAVSEITLMDAMSAYFDYGVRTLCGFPRFTLQGSASDWREIRGRVRLFREIDQELAFWFDHLDPVLDELVKASEGRADTALWSNFYKVSGGSGGPFVSGWINTLFPYLVRDRVNPDLDWTKNVGAIMSGRNPSDFPKGLSEVPVKWRYYEDTFDMKFVGGLLGTSENVENGNALQPQFGWCVYDATEKPRFEASASAEL